MRREKEVGVGMVVIVAFARVGGGARWLSGTHSGGAEAVYTARFRTLGGLGVGNPGALRGVRVGRVEAIRLAPGNWVEADLKIYAGVAVPTRPAVLPASASPFGGWAAEVVVQDQLPHDPNVRRDIAAAAPAAGPKSPGRPLPDHGPPTTPPTR